MSLKNILSLKMCSYVTKISESKVLLTPLYQEIKQNIAFEWIRKERQMPKMNALIEPILSPLNTIQFKQINSLKNILTNYESTYKEWIEESCDPFAIIKRFVCVRNSNKSESFWNGSEFDCLVFALFCPKHQSLHWFQKLQGIHNHWFRNLSKSPLKSKFSFEIKDKSQKWIMNYESDDISYPLETIEYFSDSLPMKDFNKRDFDLILCNIDLDNSTSAFICDAFTQKEFSGGHIRNIMRLNTRLAPFKIAFTFEENTVISDALIDLTNYLIQSLKELDISVFPFVSNNIISLNRCDELGIPYNVILNNDTSHNGVIAIRSRDTDTEESTHVSRFQQTICLFLKLIPSTNFSIKEKNKI